MGIPDAVVTTSWGWLLVLFALLLTQAKPFLDWIIWRKSQNAIDSMLAELSKAVEIKAKLDPKSQPLKYIDNFIDVNLEVLSSYGEVRAIKDNRRIYRAHKRLNPGRRRKFITYGVSIVGALGILIVGAIIIYNAMEEVLGDIISLPMFIVVVAIFIPLMLANVIVGEDDYRTESSRRTRRF